MNTYLEISRFNSADLVTALQEVARQEKAYSLLVIWHLSVVAERKLHLEAGYSSLFSYCVEVLKYDDGAAYRRVKAARLWKSHPEIAEDLESAQLSLSTAAVIQGHFDRAPHSPEQQKQVIAAARGKSKRKLESDLRGANLKKMEFYFDEEFLAELHELRDLSAHAETDVTELIKTAVREKLKRLRTKRFGAKTRSAGKSTFPGKCTEEKLGRQSIPAAIRKQVQDRDQGQCQFESPESQKKCRSRFALELDHIIPVELGGRNTADNLRLLCSAHHRLRHLPELRGCASESIKEQECSAGTSIQLDNSAHDL